MCDIGRIQFHRSKGFHIVVESIPAFKRESIAKGGVKCGVRGGDININESVMKTLK